jgi:ribosomal protein S18 acetylase RimI-like enzyme
MTEQMVIRPFELQDEPAVIELWQRVFPDDPPWNKPIDVIRRKLLVQNELFFVCVVEGRLAGTVLAGFDGVRGWVHKLAVFPEFQRHGIASRLMNAAEEALRSMGCPKVNLQVRSSNAAVVNFYERAGYSIEDRISMGKHLEP